VVLMTLDAALRDELLELGAANLSDSCSGEGALDPLIVAQWEGARLCGPALPVECGFGDNLAIHRALEAATPGVVLVVNARGHRAGYCGEVMAVAAVARGVAGLVVDGCVRDSDAIAELGLPVFALGRSILKTVKHEPGRVGEPVVAGGVLVRPGDVIVGDADGVVAVRAERLDEVVAASRARVVKEAGVMERLRAGELTMDVLGLR
jgi:4-hydroxy-4-methyl-2-oxoglutarate aldolase